MPRGDRDAKETRAAFKLAATKRINSPGSLDLLIRAAVAFLRGLDRSAPRLSATFLLSRDSLRASLATGYACIACTRARTRDLSSPRSFRLPTGWYRLPNRIDLILINFYIFVKKLEYFNKEIIATLSRHFSLNPYKSHKILTISFSFLILYLFGINCLKILKIFSFFP